MPSGCRVISMALKQVVALGAVLLLVGIVGPVAAAKGRTYYPVLFFHGLGGSPLTYDVVIDPKKPLRGCEGLPAGTFQFILPTLDFDPISNIGIPDECLISLFSIYFNPARKGIGKGKGFSNARGVNVSIPLFGKPGCAPGYTDASLPGNGPGLPQGAELYTAMLKAGYKPGIDLLFACYDWRASPNVNLLTGRSFLLPAAKSMILQMYQNTGKPVYLVGHSYGGAIAKFVASALPASFKQKYVAGLIGLSGDFGGQSSQYPQMLVPVQGNIIRTWPSFASDSANPSVIGDKEVSVVDASTGKAYTPGNITKFFVDAGFGKIVPGFKFAVDANSAKLPPAVDVYILHGADIVTLEGVVVSNFTIPEPIDFLVGLGDGVLDYHTLRAPLLWKKQPCHRFAIEPISNASHVPFVGYPMVVKKVMARLQVKPKPCPLYTYKSYRIK